MRFLWSYLVLCIIGWLLFGCACLPHTGQDQIPLERILEMNWNRRNAQVEVGGPFVGIETYASSPLLSRISFFYPVANSMDWSTDYWKRERFRIQHLGLRVGGGLREWIGLEPFSYRLTPYRVTFHQSVPSRAVDISYEFCGKKPAMVATICITNHSEFTDIFEFFCRYDLACRTSHTYAFQNDAEIESDSAGSTVYVQFTDSSTGKACVFISNAGEKPVAFSVWKENHDSSIPEDNGWFLEKTPDSSSSMEPANLHHPTAGFVYRRELAPQEKMSVVQIVGSCKRNERKTMAAYLRNRYRDDIRLYESHIQKKTTGSGVVETGDSDLNHSVLWSKAILGANAHYIDGEIVPMPCPAEYNFFFTHDVLMTDLGAVTFDLERVKKDLNYIASHADSDKTIPHAYYWKDDRYVTEFAGSDNWNHLWFVLLAARYLRHSNDRFMLETLYPYLVRSLTLALKNKGEDGLIWAYRPDWWDIGKSFGPRSYMTILSIQALKEFQYLSHVLGKEILPLFPSETQMVYMEEQLTQRLWNESWNYLLNINKNNDVDAHLYIGSLLAAHFDMLEETKKVALVETATSLLLDPAVGIRNVFPMDFQNLVDFFHFNGNEAGDPCRYLNGGIWPHGNAWYALALLSIQRKEEAFEFVKRIMTVRGIADSPNGQPAMYEYRRSDEENERLHGKVDKPQFLWAAGWTLYTVYHILGLRENVWNVSLDPFLPDRSETVCFTIMLKGKPIQVCVKGRGTAVQTIAFDGKSNPSLVIPETPSVEKTIDVTFGEPESPYLTQAHSMVRSCAVQKQRLTVNLEAFPGHRSGLRVISPVQPERIVQNGKEIPLQWKAAVVNGIVAVNVDFIHENTVDCIELSF